MPKLFWKILALTLATVLSTLILAIGHIFSVQAISAPQPQLMAQITSVDELSDVIPEDYYYPSIKSLVEKYGCVESFPDGTFRAERPIARIELASIIVSCVDVALQFVEPPPDVAEFESLENLIEEFQQEVTSIQR
jgi:hypothetical protein